MSIVNVVVPMAGAGSRFAKQGYKEPKPFIEVEKGKTMIELVLENILLTKGSLTLANLILIVREKDYKDKYSFLMKLKKDVLMKHSVISLDFVTVESMTEGAACTVLLARDKMIYDAPLLIANSDQIIKNFSSSWFHNPTSSAILCFRNSTKERCWSYAKTVGGYVIQVAEKDPISDLATCGVYVFKTARTFIDAAVDMIVRNDRTNGEFYICPVFNYALLNSDVVVAKIISKEEMVSLGTPEFLREYQASLEGELE